ncbi:MAG: hypothetical protein WD294_15185 [Phycisphaeraceae bacterium]
MLLHGGCTIARGPAQETPRRVGGAAAGQPVTSPELDELTRAFADRYVGLLYSVSDAIKKENPDPAQRREAQVLLLDCSTNVYDIASNADSFTRVLDLVVVTSLLTHVWVEEGRATEVFGERGAPLVRAMSRASEESRDLAARVLTAEQLRDLDTLLQDWWEENPDMVRVSFIRFSNFAIGRGASAASNVLDARGQFAEIGHAGQAVDEARLLGERMFYRFKREPTLLRWQTEAMKDDLLATPQLATALADVHRLTEQIEQLPAHVAAERQAALAGFEEAVQRADATIAKVTAAMTESQALVASLEPVGESFNELLTTGNALFQQFEAWDRWNTDTGARPFDIREHADAARELALAAEGMNQLLLKSQQLLESPQWDDRMRQVNESADGRIALFADQGHLVLDAFFWRMCALLAVLFAMLILYRLISLMLGKRFDRPADATPLPAVGMNHNDAPRAQRRVSS